jgi:superfamily I DNA and/or RNA helicase
VLDQFTANLDNENTYRFFRRMLLQKPDKDDKWVIAKERTILQCFKGSGLETTLKQDELGRFQESLQRAIQSRRNIFSLLRWKLFSKDRVFITRVLMANELKSNREGFKILLQKIDNRLNYEHNISTIDAEEWLFDFPKTSKKLDIENWFFYQRNALKTFGQFQQLRNLDVYISFKNDHRKSQIQLLKDFSNLIDTLPVQQQIWKRYMSDKQLAELLSGVVSKTDALKELERDFDNLVDFHGLKNNFTSIEQNVADQLQQEAGTIEEKLQYFQNSLALAWIENIESKYPVLRTISTLLFDQNIKELRECVEKKRETGTEIVLLKSREKTYDDLEFNRLQNQLTYRDLLHQVSKKKRIWPLRKVITEYSEELFKLIPCWMVSPESASAIFPMAESFDLVIFDEASQCFAERGIPGMYRGKQVVIAGDEMQLKPFDLYKPRWTDEETEDPDLEVDSLQKQESGTYRVLQSTFLQRKTKTIAGKIQCKQSK